MWEIFCRQHPERIFGQATPEFACDHYHRWKEDVHHIRDLGHNTYRFSLSWPRIIPDGDGEINAQGLAFYHGLIEATISGLFWTIFPGSTGLKNATVSSMLIEKPSPELQSKAPPGSVRSPQTTDSDRPNYREEVSNTFNSVAY